MNVRVEQLATHGVPRSDTKLRLCGEKLSHILKISARAPTYCFATPLHKQSKLRLDLIQYYGSGDKLEAHLSCVEGRLKLCSDILQLRRTTGISIRMSLTRENDRFTKLQRQALSYHYSGLVQSGSVEALRVLYLNVYLTRTALSEQSREALTKNVFPFFPDDLYTYEWDAFLQKLSATLLELLRVTGHAPYGRVLKPYSSWLESSAIYISKDNGLTALEDLLMVASLLAGCSHASLKSPLEMEGIIVSAPHFGTFRSKEIWLDTAEILLHDPERFDLTLADVSRIKEEVLTVGQAGPGPRRLIRFVAGDAVTKGVFIQKEEVKYNDLIQDMLLHFQQRFQVEGVIQTYFQMCEASKGIADLFSNTGVPYVSFSGFSPAGEQDKFDEDVNAPPLVQQKWKILAKRFFDKYPRMHDKLLHKLSGVAQARTTGLGETLLATGTPEETLVTTGNHEEELVGSGRVEDALLAGALVNLEDCD